MTDFVVTPGEICVWLEPTTKAAERIARYLASVKVADWEDGLIEVPEGEWPAVESWLTESGYTMGASA